MRWLFVMGVALEATGAILIVFPTLRGIAVPSRRSEELDSIEAGAMAPHAYVLAGAVLLFVGFLVQFAGYVWQFWAWYFLVVPLLGASVVGFAAAQIAFYLRLYGKINAISLVGADTRSYYDIFGTGDLIIAPSQSGETADVI